MLDKQEEYPASPRRNSLFLYVAPPGEQLSPLEKFSRMPSRDLPEGVPSHGGGHGRALQPARVKTVGPSLSEAPDQAHRPHLQNKTGRMAKISLSLPACGSPYADFEHMRRCPGACKPVPGETHDRPGVPGEVFRPFFDFDGRDGRHIPLIKPHHIRVQLSIQAGEVQAEFRPEPAPLQKSVCAALQLLSGYLRQREPLQNELRRGAVLQVRGGYPAADHPPRPETAPHHRYSLLPRPEDGAGGDGARAASLHNAVLFHAQG